MKFYFAANASKAIKLPSGNRVVFEVVRFFAGSWEGIFATETPDLISELDQLSNNPRSGITAITEEQFRLKKNRLTLAPSIESSPRPPHPALAVEDRVGRLVEGDKAPTHAPITPATPPRVFENVDEVLKLGVVKPVAELAKAPSPKRDEGEPSARSKGPPSRRPKHRKEPTVKPEEDE